MFERDGRTCQVCRRHEAELEPASEWLVCDHWPDGVLETADPFEPAACRALCSTCSGVEDGQAKPGF